MAGCGLFFGSDTKSAWSVNETVYFHQGFSAGPTLMTTEQGEVFEERRYEPFGVDIDSYWETDISSAPVSFQTGSVDFDKEPTNILNKTSDPITKWSYHGARWVAPQTARWSTPDPIVKAPDAKFMAEPWALHPYQYVHQNPVIYWDPDGRERLQLEQYRITDNFTVLDALNEWNRGVYKKGDRFQATGFEKALAFGIGTISREIRSGTSFHLVVEATSIPNPSGPGRLVYINRFWKVYQGSGGGTKTYNKWGELVEESGGKPVESVLSPIDFIGGGGGLVRSALRSGGSRAARAAAAGAGSGLVASQGTTSAAKRFVLYAFTPSLPFSPMESQSSPDLEAGFAVVSCGER
jgi:RHS repeat-associated protein